MGTRPCSLPATHDALLARDASPAYKRGTYDFARFYGLLIDGIQIGYVNGFAYHQVMPAPEAEMPEAPDEHT